MFKVPKKAQKKTMAVKQPEKPRNFQTGKTQKANRLSLQKEEKNKTGGHSDHE